MRARPLPAGRGTSDASNYLEPDHLHLSQLGRTRIADALRDSGLNEIDPTRAIPCRESSSQTCIGPGQSQ
jgi:hypothetical protein